MRRLLRLTHASSTFRLISAELQHVQVDQRRIVHDVGVVLAGEHEAGAAHVRRELVDLVETPVHNRTADDWIAQVADDEVVGLRLGVGRELEVDAAHPATFALEPLHHVAADEPACAKDERFLQSRLPVGRASARRLRSSCGSGFSPTPPIFLWVGLQPDASCANCHKPRRPEGRPTTSRHPCGSGFSPTRPAPTATNPVGLKADPRASPPRRPEGRPTCFATLSA